MLDRFRPDAAVVYRALRDSDAPVSAPDLAGRCFPVPTDEGDPSYSAIAKRSLRRVFDSLVWMRHQGVAVFAVPDPVGATTFSLTPVEWAPAPHAPDEDSSGASFGPRLRASRASRPLAPPVQPSDVMGVDLWHEG